MTAEADGRATVGSGTFRSRPSTDDLRRLIPPALVPAIVRRRSRGASRDPGIVEQARLQMEFLLAKSGAASRIQDAASGYIWWRYWRGEARWHPGLLTRQRVEGVERLLAQRDPARGLLVTIMHHGQFDGVSGSLARVGLSCHVVAHHKMFLPTAPAWLRQHVRVSTSGGVPVNVAEGAAGISARLAAGAAVLLAIDVPGRTPVTFAGRQLLGTSGASRIATAMDVPVVVVTAHRGDDGRPFLRVSEPLEPRAYASAEAFFADLLRRHEGAVLAWPEAAAAPAERWTLVEEGDKARFGRDRGSWVI